MLVAATAFLAAGCGGGDGGGNSKTQTSVSGLPQSIGKGEGALNLIEWPYYSDKSFADKFEQQTGCMIKRKDAGSSNQMVALMRTGGGGGGGQYDMVSASGDASLRLIAGGDVRLGERSLRGRSPEVVARSGVALVPEGRRIFGELTVDENLRLGLRARRSMDGAAQDVDRAFELFPVVREFRSRQAGALSGGQQQQLAIARALVSAPDVLLLDEPSLGLSPTVTDAVFEALAAIRDQGLAVVLVEQRAQRTVALANRCHVLANGEVRLTLTPDDAADTERMIHAYLS